MNKFFLSSQSAVRKNWTRYRNLKIWNPPTHKIFWDWRLPYIPVIFSIFLFIRVTTCWSRQGWTESRFNKEGEEEAKFTCSAQHTRNDATVTYRIRSLYVLSPAGVHIVIGHFTFQTRLFTLLWVAKIEWLFPESRKKKKGTQTSCFSTGSLLDRKYCCLFFLIFALVLVDNTYVIIHWFLNI